MGIKAVLCRLGDRLYYDLLSQELSGMGSVLDVGCGARSPLQEINKTFISVGFDVFEPSLKQSRKAKIHDDYVLGNVLKIESYFKPKSFDAVIALDLIEHIDKKDGLDFLRNMESIARKKVIVMTPNGYYRQDPYENNPYQVHQSGWKADDFRRRGYRVSGIRGLRFLRGECASIKHSPWILWGSISALSQMMLKNYPDLSYQLFAVKTLP